MEPLPNPSQPGGASPQHRPPAVDVTGPARPAGDPELPRGAATWADRRPQERFVVTTFCPVRLLARPSLQPFGGFLRELSRGAIELLVSRFLEPGTVLAVQLRKRPNGVSGILTAQVRHASRVLSAFWRVDCRLSRNLTDDEIAALLLGEPERELDDEGLEEWR